MDNSLSIKLPAWVLPCILTLTIAVATLIYAYGAQSRQITINTAAIANKVNYKPEFEMIMSQIQSLERSNIGTLNRIENKLDNHIKDSK
jgi:hypothetical protein